MTIENLSDLIYLDFDLKNITVTPYVFDALDRVEYKQGRKNNLLHMVTFGTRTYQVNGREFEVAAGGVILIPKGTRYCTYTKEKCSGTGICFDMAGETEHLLPPDVYIYWQRDIAAQIQKMEELYFKLPAEITALKAILFNVLYTLARGKAHSEKDYRMIKPALDHMALHFTRNEKTAAYAALCNMSDSYFRKTFTRCMGISPIGYRNELRFSLARQLYTEGNTLQQIAERTGFYDAGFFSKAYKKHTGTTLRQTAEIGADRLK